MKTLHPKPRVAVTAVRVHPFYYHTVYGPKQQLIHCVNQLCRAVAMLFFCFCFGRFALMAPSVPAIVHIPGLVVLMAIILLIGNRINESSRGRAKFKKFDKLKKSAVVYTRNKKLRCANDNAH